MAELLPRIPAVPLTFQASWEARACAEVLRQTVDQDVVPYAVLVQAAGGLDIQRKRRDILHTARAIVLREDDLVFEAVRNVGLKRLSAGEVVALSEDRRQRVRRAADRQLRNLRTVSFQALEEPLRTKALAYAGLFVAVGSIVATKTLNFIEQHGHMPDIPPLTAPQVQGLFR